MFLKISETFLPPRRRLSTSNKCRMGTQTRNHLGNTEENTDFESLSNNPCLPTNTTYDEDAEFSSQKQKCLGFFQFAHLQQMSHGDPNQESFGKY